MVDLYLFISADDCMIVIVCRHSRAFVSICRIYSSRVLLSADRLSKFRFCTIIFYMELAVFFREVSFFPFVFSFLLFYFVLYFSS